MPRCSFLDTTLLFRGLITGKGREQKCNYLLVLTQLCYMCGHACETQIFCLRCRYWTHVVVCWQHWAMVYGLQWCCFQKSFKLLSWQISATIMWRGGYCLRDLTRFGKLLGDQLQVLVNFESCQNKLIECDLHQTLCFLCLQPRWWTARASPPLRSGVN